MSAAKRSVADGYDVLTWVHVREFLRDFDPDGETTFAKLNDARLRLTPMLGYIFRVRGEIAAIGGVFNVTGARWEAMFAFNPKTPDFAANTRHSRWVHRAALEVLELAHRVAPVVYARADDEVPKARRWLKRLGFVEPEANGDYWTHGVCCSNGDSGQLISDEQLDGRGLARIGGD